MVTDNLTPTSPAEWQGKVEVQGQDLKLPSGNVCRVRQITPQAFLANGLIPDPLTPLIRKAINDRKGLRPKEIQKISDDPEMIVSALQMFDQVLAYVMVAPNIMMPPTCKTCGEYYNNGKHDDPRSEGYHAYQEDARDPGLLYADQVTMEDKMFIFQWAMGGTKDIESFRSEFNSTVADLPDSKGD